MRKRRIIAGAMVAGLIWSVALLWLGAQVQRADPVADSFFAALAVSLLPGGIVMLLMIGRLAQRRFFDDTIIDGDAFVPGSGADIDQRVLTNTAEQLVLAACIWPFVGVTLGSQIIIVMGMSFAAMRLAFWVGYHLSPPLRGFGFAASFYPTPLAALWAMAHSFTG